MRVIKDGSKGLLQKKPDDAETPAGVKEVETTCTGCVSEFAFNILDEGVKIDNEGDFNVECPVCGTTLVVGKVTGIVHQRNTGD